MRLPLQFKASLLIASILVVASLISTSIFITRQMRDIERNMIDKGDAVIYALAKTAETGILTESLDLLNKSAHIVDREGITAIQIYSTTWDAIDAHPIERLHSPPLPEAIEHFKVSDAILHKGIDNAYDFYSAISYNAGPEKPFLRIGYARIIFSADNMHRAIRKSILLGIVTSACLTILSILIVNIVVRRLLVNPLSRLTNSMTQLKGGTAADDLIDRSDDEVGRLSEAFNSMKNALLEKEDTLKESEKHIKLLLNSIGEGIYGVDLEGNCTFCNPPALQMLGYERSEDLLGKKIHALIHHTLPDGTHYHSKDCKIYNAYREGKGVYVVDEVFWRSDGTSFPVEYRAQPIMRNGSPIGAVTAFTDITEHIKLEDQLRQSQKMESIGTLAGGIAHDFNNILTAIIGYGHITLMKMAKDDPNRLNIEQILVSSDRAAHLTKDLLLFSRKQPIDRKSVDLNHIIMKLEKFLVRVIGEDIDFKTALSGGPLDILADMHQIEQVLMNLATNARDAMTKGGILSITTEPVMLDAGFYGISKPGIYAMITVSDTGKGMDKETREHIFEPFYTTKEVGKGTGLGMSVVYGIVKQHEGHINVYSEPGIGTAFRVYLPVVESGTAGEDAAVVEEEPEGGTETILLAEDDETLRTLAASLLKEFGYNVIIAVDGEDAVSKYMENRESIQLLLFDLIMPNKNGKEAYDEIRKITPGIKVLFASGYSSDIVQNKTSLGKDANIIYKPILPTDLLKKVRRMLD